MSGRVDDINPDVLLQCRIQVGLELSDVLKKIPKIAEIEEGSIKPTFKQLDVLSQLYNVPRWVFISEVLPEKYRFDTAIPAFRKFSRDNSDVFSDSKLRNLTTKVERFRELIMDLLEDMGEPAPVFNPPQISSSSSPEIVGALVRKWFDVHDSHPDFMECKKLLEEKGIFIFLTSKYKGWSNLDKNLVRGLTIYHPTLPVIIINDSDSKKARSFTLFHELGHLLRKESTIDGWNYHSQETERWCDNLAGSVLMPKPLFMFEPNDIESLSSVKRIAGKFNVSTYACLVRMLQLNIINRKIYSDFEKELIEEYTRVQEKIKEDSVRLSRNRSREILNQYGSIYTNVLFQAYHNNEIGLHKLTKLFDLNRTSYLLDIEASL